MSDEGKPLSYGTLIPKLEVADTNGKATALTISATRRQNMARSGPPEYKIVLTFGEDFDAPAQFDGDPDDATKREYIVNATSYKTLCLMYGDDESRWVGRPVAMKPVETTFDRRKFTKMHVAPRNEWDAIIGAVTGARKRK